jgi:DNA-directed RNA polymerase specialized sigma24 family protein
LPPKQQSVVGLYYLRELSIQETADLLGVRPGTVKSRLHYGLRALRVHLEQDRRFGGAYVPPVRPAAEKAEVRGG